MNAKKFYLAKLFKRNSFLFWLSITFIACQAFFTYKGVETVPFFNFGMYSEVFTLIEDHEVIAIYLDTIRIDKHPKDRFPLDLILETLDYYHQLNNREFSDPILGPINKRFKNRVSEKTLNRVIEMLANDPLDKAAYETWVFNFVKGFYKEDAQSLRVEIEKYEFVENRLQFRSKQLLFEYGQRR